MPNTLEQHDDQRNVAVDDDEKLAHKIRRRAYQIWSEEGQPAGHDREHWIRARAEVLEAQPRRDSI